LVKLESVIALPHSGSKTIAARERMSIWAAQSMADVHSSKIPKYVVNREVLKDLELS
jgi:lactate dehydrogenase-like 2-hydroxyacid dehydrogenase